MGRQDYETETLITHSLRGEGFDASEDGTGRGTPLVSVAFAQNQLGEVRTGDVVNTLNTNANASGRNTPMIAFGWQNSASRGDSVSEHVTPGLDTSKVPAVAYGVGVDTTGHQGEKVFGDGDAWPCLSAGGGNNGGGAGAILNTHSTVRRLTPRECERLQGFPDDHTLVPYRGKPAADGPRYKALGNSMAVPCMAYIGRRISMVERLADVASAVAPPAA